MISFFRKLSSSLSPAGKPPQPPAPAPAPATETIAGSSKRAAAPAAKQEIMLHVGDVLGRIPPHYLKPGPHDARQELRFKIEDLSEKIARGRASIALSKLVELCPEIFRDTLDLSNDVEIQLPLQKLVEQVGNFVPEPAPESELAPESAPAQGSVRNGSRAPEKREEPSPSPLPAAPAPSVAPVPPERESAKTEVEPKAAVPVPDAELRKDPAVLKTSVAPESSAALNAKDGGPESEPATKEESAVVTKPQSASESEPATSSAKPTTSDETPVKTPPVECGAAILEPAKSAAPVEPVKLAKPAAPATPNEPVQNQAQQQPAPPAASETAGTAPIEASVDGAENPTISLGLVPIFRLLPGSVTGSAPAPETDDRIELPLRLVEPQIATGHVEVPLEEFLKALPEKLRDGMVRVPDFGVWIPLDEVFQNLPTDRQIALSTSTSAQQKTNEPAGPSSP